MCPNRDRFYGLCRLASYLIALLKIDPHVESLQEIQSKQPVHSASRRQSVTQSLEVRSRLSQTLQTFQFYPGAILDAASSSY
jgi:hypothetical protein